MKKRITKIFVLTGLLVLMAIGLTGCEKKECYLCQEMGKCTTKKLLDKEVDICEDCMKDLEDIEDFFD